MWNYTWDAENRLIRMTNATTLASSNRLLLAFEYDGKGRRIRKTVTRLDTSAVVLDNKFLYDGWNLIAELNATNNNVIRNYLWGTDLSGSMQGAGGVGGLLKMTYHTPNATNYFVAYDGNGNVAGLIQADTGTHVVTYEYGPFGEPIRNSGAWSTSTKTCPIRFSSKYNDEETDLLYYGQRYYSPYLGR